MTNQIPEAQKSVDMEKLSKYLKEIQHFYTTMQDTRGDDLFTKVKVHFNISYSELSRLLKEYNNSEKLAIKIQ